MLDFVSFFINKKENQFKNIIFPPTCIICGKTNKNYICENCNKRLKKYEKVKLIRK